MSLIFRKSKFSRGVDMYLVQVDDGLPEVRLLLVEVSHTNLTKVTGMVLIAKSQPNFVRVSVPSRICCEPCPCWYGGGADHQRDLDHRDAFCAFRHVPYRRRRGRGYKAKKCQSLHNLELPLQRQGAQSLSASIGNGRRTYCLRVFERRVGMATVCGVVAFPVSSRVKD
jgi:hypothetical protein